MTSRRFDPKRLPDGRAMLNLGCGVRVAAGWTNVDGGWLVRLGRRPRLSALLRRVGLLSLARYKRTRRADPATIVWDLSRGIPFEDAAFDVVYHSHLLEHLDRDDTPTFLRECLRVLRPGGILRVVVPDLELLARRYVAAADRLDHGDQGAAPDRDTAAEGLFDQMIVRRPRHRAAEGALVRKLEDLLVGDTARAGILHRWMYDRFSLSRLMADAGFVDVRRHSAATSDIAGWAAFALDAAPDGSPHKADSLYMEGRRP